MMMRTHTLEHRLRTALQPVEPRPAFVARLRAQLAPATGAPQRPTAWVVVLAGVGGALSLVSMLLIGRRFGRWITALAAPRPARSA